MAAGDSFRYPNNATEEPLVSGNFGPRTPIWTPAGWTSNFHHGVDMVGWPRITSPVTGRVTAASYAGDFGNRVIIVEDGTGIEHRLCHLDSMAVRRGDQVTVGQFVGIMGTTGKSTGVHLHWEVRPGGGAAIDPRPYARQRIAADSNRPAPPSPQPSQEADMFNLVVRKKSGGTKMFFVLPNPAAARDANQKPYLAMVIDGPAPTGIPTYDASGQWSEPYAVRHIQDVNFN